MRLPPSPYSRRLASKGLYSRYTHRFGAVAAAASVCGSLVMGGLHFPGEVAALAQAHYIVASLLYALPVVAGVSSGVALQVARAQSREGDDALASPLLSFLDSLSWTLSLVSLAAYVVLLIVPPTHLDPGIRSVFSGVVVAYWLGATTLACSAFPSGVRWSYLAAVLALLLTMPARFGLADGTTIVIWVLQTGCFALLITLGMTWVFARADELDESHRAELAGREELLAAETRATARRRTNEFVHDHVLSVLTAVATYPNNAPPLQRAALDAREVLLGRNAEVPLSNVGDLVDAVRTRHPEAAVTAQPGVETYQLGGVEPHVYAAISEAVSNALKHGGTPERPRPRIRVSFTVEDAAFTVRIADDGTGFSREEAARPGRFGLDHGIFSRMEEAGGRAAVASTPGEGTVVTLSWPSSTRADHVKESVASRFHWREGLGRSLDTRTAKAYGLIVVVVQVTVVVLARDQYSSLIPSLVVLPLFALLTFGVLLRPWPGTRVPSLYAWATSAFVGLGNCLVLSSIGTLSGVGASMWTLEFGALIACGLLVRKQAAAAWVTVGFLGTSALVWTFKTDHSSLVAVGLIGGHVLILLLWTVLVGVSSQAVFDLTLSDKNVSRIAAERAIQAEVRDQVTATLRRVSERAGPLIVPVALGMELTGEMKLDARLLEAELRDEIRAASFVNTSVSAAATEARRRGVEVVLLDDSVEGSAPTVIPRRFVVRACQVLAEATDGRVVIRLQPAGSEAVGTIVGPSGSEVIH